MRSFWRSLAESWPAPAFAAFIIFSLLAIVLAIQESTH